MKEGDKVLVEGVIDFGPIYDEDTEQDFVRVGFESPYKLPHGMAYVMLPVKVVKPKE